MAAIMGQSNADLQRSQLGLRKELGVANAQQTAAEIEAGDPRGFAVRQQIMDRVGGDLNKGASIVPYNAQIQSGEDRLARLADKAPQADGRLSDIYDQATRLPGAVSDSSTAALNEGLQKALEEFRLGGKLDEASRRDLLNDVRAGQASRGNFLGDAAAVVEATEQGKAGQAMKQQRLANLIDLQGRAFGQNSALRQEGTQNQFNRLGAMAGFAGQDFGQKNQAFQSGLQGAAAAFQGAQGRAADERASRQEGWGYDQQRLANAQGAALGAPLSNQFGNLGGAQNGAVGFQGINFQGGAGLNQNAGNQGANFAQGIYGTNAGMWGQQAQIASQGNPWMSLLGTGLGAASGGFGSALGGLFGGR
jgi:hypothetical protein